MKNIYVGNIPIIEQGGSTFNINNYLKNAQTLDSFLFSNFKDGKYNAGADVYNLLNGKFFYVHGVVDQDVIVNGYASFYYTTKTPQTSADTPRIKPSFSVNLYNLDTRSSDYDEYWDEIRITLAVYLYSRDQATYDEHNYISSNVTKTGYYRYEYTLEKVADCHFQIYVGDLPDNLKY